MGFVGYQKLPVDKRLFCYQVVHIQEQGIVVLGKGDNLIITVAVQIMKKHIIGLHRFEVIGLIDDAAGKAFNVNKIAFLRTVMHL